MTDDATIPASAASPLKSGRRARVTAVTSGKGGVGKTFASVNLAAALAARGRRVLVLDADLGLANLDVVLNLSPKRTLHDVFTGRCTLDQALVEVSGGFTVLLAGSGMVEYSRLTPEVRDKLIDTLDAVAPRFDHVLLDTGAGISDVVLYTVSLADEVVVVVTPEPTSMTDAYATIKVLASTQRRRRVRLLVNQRVPGTDGPGITAQLQRVIDRHVNPTLEAPLVLELIGDVPADNSVRDVVRRRALLIETFPGCPAAQAITAAAGRLSSGS